MTDLIKHFNMNYTNDEIKKIATNFVHTAIKNEIPNGYGFSICFPLSILFSILKINHKIAIGYATMNKMSTSHFWIKLEMDDLILDPTIRQFDTSKDIIYLGKIMDDEITKQYVESNNIGEEEFYEIYESWSAPLYEKEDRILRSKIFEDRMNLINIQIAMSFIECIKEYGLEVQILNNELLKLYLKPIEYNLRFRLKDGIRNSIHHLNENFHTDLVDMISKYN
jgi:hypothetical protein